MAKTHYICDSCADGYPCELFVQPPHTKPTHCPIFTDEEQDERAKWESDAPAQIMEVKQFFRELKNVCDKQQCDCCVIEWFCGFNLPHIKDEDIDKVFQDANIRGGENRK